MKKIRLILLAMSVGLIAACTTPRSPAPVVERTTSNKPLVPGPAKPTQKPVEERGYYTVKKGDTLIHIALEVGQNYRDLVAWNNLANANDIKVDQVLRVLPPYSNAGPGAPQTGSVAITSGVEVRPLSTPPSVSSAPPATAAVPSAAMANNKSSPRADKRPYSEAALAELQKPDSAPALPMVAKLEPAKQPEMRTTDKVSEAPEEEAVAWMWPGGGKSYREFR